MKLSNKVRENLSKLLNKIDFIETSRNSHDVMEWLHGKIKGRRVVICLWNSCMGYKNLYCKLISMMILLKVLSKLKAIY